MELKCYNVFLAAFYKNREKKNVFYVSNCGKFSVRAKLKLRKFLFVFIADYKVIFAAFLLCGGSLRGESEWETVNVFEDFDL